MAETEDETQPEPAHERTQELPHDLPPGPAPSPPGSGTGGPPSSDLVDHLREQLRRLRRSRHDSVFAGVCGGLARSLGIDPLLLRVVTAVLVLFGGAGVLLYATAWLLLPVDDGTASLSTQVLERHRYGPRSETTILTIFLVVVITCSATGVLKAWPGSVLVGLVALAALLVLRGRTVPLPCADVQDGHAPAVVVPPSTAQAGAPAYDCPPAVPVQAPYAAPPRPRSGLFGLTFSTVIIGWGLLAAADALRYDPPVGAYPALGLALTGLGLLVGAWHGRARWLIVWGLLLALLLAPAALVDEASHVRGPSFTGTKVVDQASELPQHARFESGRVEYDLRRLDLAGRSGRMDVQMGFGQVVVLLPEGVDATVRASASTGALTVFGTQSGGLGTHLNRTDVGVDGPGGGTLDITLYAGIGHLEVRRATS